MEENSESKPEHHEPVERPVEAPKKVKTIGPTIRPGLGSVPWLAVLLAASPALLLLAWRSDDPWLAPLLGRFHPTVVHFPIALLLFVGVVELVSLLSLGRVRARTRLMLFVGAASAVAAAALGVMLRKADGVEGDLVQWHFIGGLVTAALALFAVFFRFARGFVVERLWRGWYRVFLLLTCASLVVASHLGASLTHGEDYLTEYAPWWKSGRAVAREPDFPADLPVGEWQVYDHVVAQVFKVRCGTCHNERNSKGGLVLESWEGLEAGGKHGAVLEPGSAEESEMIRRLLLPLDDDDHMPPKKKPQPSEEEIELLSRWIEAGAPRFGTVDTVDPSGELKGLVRDVRKSLSAVEPMPVEHEEIDHDAVEEAREKGAAIVRKLQKDYPGVVGYESRQSANLHVNATVMGERFDDDDLAGFSSLAPQITWLDLTGTDVTDDSARILAKMTNLRTLRLGRTDVGDETVVALAPLGSLQSLSLFETKVTEASAEAIQAMPSLKNLYADGTPLADASREAPASDRE